MEGGKGEEKGEAEAEVGSSRWSRCWRARHERSRRVLTRRYPEALRSWEAVTIELISCTAGWSGLGGLKKH